MRSATFLLHTLPSYARTASEQTVLLDSRFLPSSSPYGLLSLITSMKPSTAFNRSCFFASSMSSASRQMRVRHLGHSAVIRFETRAQTTSSLRSLTPRHHPRRLWPPGCFTFSLDLTTSKTRESSSSAFAFCIRTTRHSRYSNRYPSRSTRSSSSCRSPRHSDRMECASLICMIAITL